MNMKKKKKILICSTYSSVADNQDFHTPSADCDQPSLFYILTQPGDKARIVLP